MILWLLDPKFRENLPARPEIPAEIVQLIDEWDKLPAVEKHALLKMNDFGNEILKMAGLNLEQLRKLEDYKWEVDVKYELTWDLYEKQRIIDYYVKDH